MRPLTKAFAEEIVELELATLRSLGLPRDVARLNGLIRAAEEAAKDLEVDAHVAALAQEKVNLDDLCESSMYLPELLLREETSRKRYQAALSEVREWAALRERNDDQHERFGSPGS